MFDHGYRAKVGEESANKDFGVPSLRDRVEPCLEVVVTVHCLPLLPACWPIVDQLCPVAWQDCVTPSLSSTGGGFAHFKGKLTEEGDAAREATGEGSRGGGQRDLHLSEGCSVTQVTGDCPVLNSSLTRPPVLCQSWSALILCKCFPGSWIKPKLSVR